MTTDTSVIPIVVDRKHHKFGPSRLEYLNSCAAFNNRVTAQSEYSEEGQKLHDYMQKMLDKVQAKEFATTLEQITNWLVFTHDVTDEQQAWLRFCCRKCDAVIALRPKKIHTELAIEVLNPDGSQLNHGYLDVLFEFENVGILVDFKFGWIPVPHAEENLQGLNYTLACLQKFPNLNKIGVKFLQPKLNTVTEAIFTREKMFDYYVQIKDLIELAQYVQEPNPDDDVQQYMHPGPWCEYCELAASCAMKANHAVVLSARYGNLPALPAQFPKSMELAKPEDWALVRYYIDIMEKGVDELKARAKEIAEANDGEIRCTLPTGEEVVYGMQERNVDRSLGSTTDIAECLKEWITLDELLSIASLPVTNLLKLAANSYYEGRKAAGDDLLEDGKKLTKKYAMELIESTLTANGLLSTPDKKIRFLKLQKGAKALEPETGAPQLTEAPPVTSYAPDQELHPQ